MAATLENNRFSEFKALAVAHARESIEAGRDTAENVAEVNCPVGEDEDGIHLRNTIAGSPIVDTGSNFDCEVTAGDTALGVDYAAPVEFGSVHPVGPGRGRPKKEPYTIAAQPFMQPGYEAGRVAALAHAETMFGGL